MPTSSNGLVIWNLGRRQSPRGLFELASRPIRERHNCNSPAAAISFPSALFQALIMYSRVTAKSLQFFHIYFDSGLISIYMQHTSLYITVMVTLYSHKLLHQSALFCSDMSYSDDQNCMVWNKTNLPAFFYLIIIGNASACIHIPLAPRAWPPHKINNPLKNNTDLAGRDLLGP